MASKPAKVEAGPGAGVEVELGERALLAIRDVLQLGGDVIVTSENAHRRLWGEALGLCGYSQYDEVGKPDAVATRKLGMEGDGLTLHVRDASGIHLLSSSYYRFAAGGGQIGLVAVLNVPKPEPERGGPDKHREAEAGGGGTIHVVGVAHLKSGLSAAKEEVRRDQLREFCRYIKQVMGEHRARAGFIVGDLNASLVEVDHAESEDGAPIPPLAVEAARDEGFKIVVPVIDGNIALGLEQTWTSLKERDVRGRDEQEECEGSAPAAKRHRKIQKKKAANDWTMVFEADNHGRGAAEPACTTPLSYLLPPTGGPCRLRAKDHSGDVRHMATEWSDHTSTFVRFGGPGWTFSIVGLNVLAPWLDDEMLGELPPALAPGSRDAAIAASKAAPRLTTRYVCQAPEGPQASAKVLSAPFRLAPTQRSYKLLAEAMERAWIASVHREMAVSGETFAQVMAHGERAESKAGLY